MASKLYRRTGKSRAMVSQRRSSSGQRFFAGSGDLEDLAVKRWIKRAGAVGFDGVVPFVRTGCASEHVVDARRGEDEAEDDNEEEAGKNVSADDPLERMGTVLQREFKGNLRDREDKRI